MVPPDGKVNILDNNQMQRYFKNWSTYNIDVTNIKYKIKFTGLYSVFVLIFYDYGKDCAVSFDMFLLLKDCALFISVLFA